MSPKALSRVELKCGKCGKWEKQEIGVFHAQLCKECITNPSSQIEDNNK